MAEQRNWKERLSPYLTDAVNALVAPVDGRLPLEELRVRAGQPLELIGGGRTRLLYALGGGAATDADGVQEMLSRVCERSVYAFEEELKNGFVTLPGGCRVGVSGRSLVEDGRVCRVLDVTGLCFRIARACPGAAAPALPYLVDGEGRVPGTLVLSPPGLGKTTLLRDLARLCSYGRAPARPMRVSVVDTRFELAGAVRGVPQFDLGPRTDVQSGGTKADGMRRMLCSMAPELLVTDELSAPEEAAAALDAAAAGVSLATSAHAPSLPSLQKRPALRLLMESGVFERYVVLGRSRGTGTVEAILDGDGRALYAGGA